MSHVHNPAAVLSPLAEVLPATSHHPATQDLVGVDPGDHKWATMGMAPSCFSVSPGGSLYLCLGFIQKHSLYVGCMEDHLTNVKVTGTCSKHWVQAKQHHYFCLNQSCTVAHAGCNKWQSTCVSLSGSGMTGVCHHSQLGKSIFVYMVFTSF